ncbi:RHS repeat domain-containing protein [Solilutibacter silvestris]|uniref:RHS repeat domain-containing protein n=1 Tax=Solilutibacter silvestris TaxID=1645665 RepID=UPI003D325753
MKTILTFCALALLFLLLPVKGQAQVVEYVHTDALGSPVAITNEAGQVIERTDYEPYGSMIGKANNDRPGYTGHVMDSATGLTYMQQRYYDPNIGRFLSTDPVAANASTGASFNRYDYANNNPYKFTDPDGRQSVMDKLVKGLNEMFANPTAQLNSPGAPQTTDAKITKAVLEAPKNVVNGAKDRTTLVAEVAAAFGPGVSGQASKAVSKNNNDSVGAQAVVGEGLYAGANAQFRIFSWGKQDGAGSSGKITVDPGSYVHVKLAAGLSLGASLDLNGAGGGKFSLSVGAGIGEQAIVKPPATLGYEKELPK